MIIGNLPTNSEENKLVVEHLYTVEGYCTYHIRVKSGDFAGKSSFCISKENVDICIEKLTIMHKDLKGRCEVKDYDSDAYVVIEMNKFGHVCVYGQIGGTHQEHSMKFKFDTDQTVLISLAQMFKI